MARRRRSIKRKTSRRRSRVGAIGKAGLMDLAYAVAGGVAAKYVSSAIISGCWRSSYCSWNVYTKKDSFDERYC